MEVEDIYSARFEKLFQKNMQEVKLLLQKGDKGLLVKINNAAKRYMIDAEYIKGQIDKEELLALAMFAKDPSKQKYHEKTAAEYIQNIQGIQEFKDNTGLYVSRGQVLDKEQAKRATAKTIDFFFKYGRLDVYVSHKYTRESGGAQDNQYKDLQEFINESRDNTDPDVLFVAVADGEYYTGKDGKLGISRMDNLKKRCTQSVKACTIYELEGILEEIS